MHLYNFLVCGPKSTKFLLSNVLGVVVDRQFIEILKADTSSTYTTVDQLRFRFLIC